MTLVDLENNRNVFLFPLQVQGEDDVLQSKTCKLSAKE